MKFRPALLLLIFFLTPAYILAQNPVNPASQSTTERVSDDELKQYLLATFMAQSIYNEDNIRMADTLKHHGLDVDKYNRILNSMKMGESQQEMDASEEDIIRFRNVSSTINKMQESMERKIVTAIESNGMGLERFDEIFEMIQHEPALKLRVETLMRDMEEWDN
ncbi:MAG: DUF4168 domain-containing protein [Cyclonatronaceae bacterium]